MGLGGLVFPLKDDVHRDLFPSLGNGGDVLAKNGPSEFVWLQQRDGRLRWRRSSWPAPTLQPEPPLCPCLTVVREGLRSQRI